MTTRKMMTRICVCLLLFAPGSTFAASMFVGYSDVCGLPVVQGPDAQIASARRDNNGAPFIHIDPSAMANWSSNRIFTLAHECAHHVLGHTSQLGAMQRYLGGTRQQELEADCWAAQRLSANGNTDAIRETIVRNSMQGHFAGNGYPSGSERAANVMNCAGGDGGGGGNLPQCTINTTPCNHPAHNGDQVHCQHAVPAHPNGDVIPCGHACPGPFGAVPCHPQGHLVQCQHAVPQHQFDVVQCRHAAHPGGHPQQVCY